MNRRKFLTLVGGGSILAAGAAFGGFAATRTPTKALQPWKDAGNAYTEPRRKALSYAILAPNPHNRQPWKIDLSQPDTIKIFVDTDRVLPHTDPFNRQITIGFGCFLEVLRIAAAQDGYSVSEQLFPQGVNEKTLDDRPIAILKLRKDSAVKKDPLFAHIINRRSTKEPFDLSRSVQKDDLVSLQSTVSDKASTGVTNNLEKVKELRSLTSAALLLEIETPRTYRESVELFRIGKAEIETNPDGISFSGPLFESLALLGVFTKQAAIDPTSSGYKQGIAAVLANTNSAMGYVWITSKSNTRKDQIDAGRDYVRMNLMATGKDLSIHPLSQALQEYPEMDEHFKTIHKMLAPNGGTIQMFARLGYGQDKGPKPRWSLTKKLLWSNKIEREK